VGCEFEPGLVSRIVADVSDQPGALPMLQYALTELYERRVSGLLTVDAYEELGGVTGALARRAEELYDGSTREQEEGIRRLFTRLVTPGEGTEDTRRRVRRSELETVPDEVIDSFGQSRLLSFDRDEATREPTVEVAHEALIREWPRLRGWLDEDRDGLRIHRHVTAAATAWETSGRDDGELYRGGRLEAAQEWLGAHPADPTPTEREFVERSVTARQAQRDKERRENRRLRRLLTVVGVVAVIALIAGAVAFAQRREAADQRDRAESEAVEAAEAGARAEAARDEADIRRLVADSANQADVDRRLALLMALEAHERDPSAESLGAIQRALVRSPQNWLTTLSGAEPYVRAQFLAENRLGAMSASGFDVWDLGARVIERTVALPPDPVSLAVAGDRGSLAIGHQDEGWEVLSTDDFSVIERGDAAGRVSAIALNENGTRLAVGTTDGTVTIHHVPSTSEPPLEIERGSEVQDLTFRPGEHLLAIGTGWNGSALVVDVDTGQLGPELTVGPENLRGADVIAWHDRGLLVGNQQEVVVADPLSGAIVAELSSVNRLNGVGAADAASGSVALTGSDGSVEYLAPGAEALTPIGRDPQVGRIESIALDPAGRLVGMVRSNGVSLLTTDGTGTLATLTLPTDVIQVRLTEDGRTALASDPSSGPISVWDLDDTDAPVDVLEFRHFAQSGRGFVFVRPNPEGGFQTALWKDGSLSPLATDEPFHAVGLSPDEQVVVVSTFSGALEVLDTRSGRLITTLDAVQEEAQTLDANRRYATDLEFTPDGGILVVAVRRPLRRDRRFPGRRVALAPRDAHAGRRSVPA
jgi:WD40 repeat protein